MSRLKELESKYEALAKEMKLLKLEKNQQNKEYDFSKFVSKCNDVIAINGNKKLKVRYYQQKSGVDYSKTEVSISYDNINWPLYEGYNLFYEKCLLSDLCEGNVFIFEEDADKPELSDFKIFADKNGQNNFHYWYLDKVFGFECIENFFIQDNCNVIKIY